MFFLVVCVVRIRNFQCIKKTDDFIVNEMSCIPFRTFLRAPDPENTLKSGIRGNFLETLKVFNSSGNCPAVKHWINFQSPTMSIFICSFLFVEIRNSSMSMICT